jgi:hypothetical protein
MNDLLITVHFNHPYYDNIPHLRKYLAQFGDFVFYGDNHYPHEHVNTVEANCEYRYMHPRGGAHWAYRSFIDSYKAHPNYERYMFMMDDDICTPEGFDFIKNNKKPCFGIFGKSLEELQNHVRPTGVKGWSWLDHHTVGPHIQQIINDKGYFCGGGRSGDVYHLYNEDMPQFIDELLYYDERNIFLEVAVAMASKKMDSVLIPENFILCDLKLSRPENQRRLNELYSNYINTRID